MVQIERECNELERDLGTLKAMKTRYSVIGNTEMVKLINTQIKDIEKSKSDKGCDKLIKGKGKK